MKYVYALMLVAGISGCKPKYTQEAKELQMRQATASLSIFQAQLVVCDNNGGVRNITHGSATTTVSCMNDVNTTVYN